jgi:hypothetical protein
VKLTGFADGFNVGHERKRGVENNSQISGVSNWEDGALIY